MKRNLADCSNFARSNPTVNCQASSKHHSGNLRLKKKIDKMQRGW